jgi:hypothetical protein
MRTCVCESAVRENVFNRLRLPRPYHIWCMAAKSVNVGQLNLVRESEGVCLCGVPFSTLQDIGAYITERYGGADFWEKAQRAYKAVYNPGFRMTSLSGSLQECHLMHASTIGPLFQSLCRFSWRWFRQTAVWGPGVMGAVNGPNSYVITVSDLLNERTDEVRAMGDGLVNVGKQTQKFYREVFFSIPGPPGLPIRGRVVMPWCLGHDSIAGTDFVGLFNKNSRLPMCSYCNGKHTVRK